MGCLPFSRCDCVHHMRVMWVPPLQWIGCGFLMRKASLPPIGPFLAFRSTCTGVCRSLKLPNPCGHVLLLHRLLVPCSSLPNVVQCTVFGMRQEHASPVLLRIVLLSRGGVAEDCLQGNIASALWELCWLTANCVRPWPPFLRIWDAVRRPPSCSCCCWR